MYRGLKIIAMAPVLNEERKIGEVVRRTPREIVDETLVIDDGCTDRSPEIARSLGATVLPMGRVAGVGAALRAGYRDRKSTRLNSSHIQKSRMPSSA